ncbi:MAG: proteasome subunit beta [Candidatus Lokiarchaeota archaeon]|nr:proteasome subunit beta [Candidatus Lokiarchaeota archaeon]MBD3341402.1 proteasome subunit beta [Candidatus Lokiarchaeota archaeon]
MNKEDLLKTVDTRIQINPTIGSKDSIQNQDNSKMTSLKSGTTTVGVTCKDAVVLGTDKRATMAYFIASKTAKKLHEIQEHCWITIAGSVADAQYLVDLLQAETSLYQLEKEKPVPIKAAGRILSNILYRNKLFPYQVGLILGGVTEKEGSVLLDIGAYGSILPEKYIAVGSGQNFSYGVLEAKYKDDLSVEEAKNIVKSAVTSSIIRDMASGNGIDIVVVRKEGPAEREFVPIK